MLSVDEAHVFAQEWINAWNSHDLERILSHYDDNFSMHSPNIIKVVNEASGQLNGKQTVGEYWRLALDNNPKLHFTMQHVLVGVTSITIIYQGVRGLSAEVFHFNSMNKVSASYAHYLPLA